MGLGLDYNIATIPLYTPCAAEVLLLGIALDYGGIKVLQGICTQ